MKKLQARAACPRSRTASGRTKRKGGWLARRREKRRLKRERSNAWSRPSAGDSVVSVVLDACTTLCDEPQQQLATGANLRPARRRSIRRRGEIVSLGDREA
jgi:hypothetical protein